MRYVDRGVTSRTGWPAPIVAALGALAVAASAYLDWYEGEMPRDMPLERLFQTEVSGGAGNYWTSVAAPLAADRHRRRDRVADCARDWC